MLALLVLIPLAVLLLHNLPFRNVRRSWLTMSVLSLAVAEVVAAISLPAWMNLEIIPLLSELKFQLVADDLTRVLLLSIGLVLGASMLVAEESIASDHKHRHFSSLLLLTLTGMNATVLLSDFFSLYVFLEVTSVASFILIAYDRGLFAVEGALRYLLLSAVASAFMLSASALLLIAAGGTSFDVVRQALGSEQASLTRLALGVFIIGLFIKSGVVPFHGWLPGAYASAPAPVSVLLAGVVSKVSGIYALIRLAVSVYAPDEKWSLVLLILGTASILVGAVAALGQTDMKRMLAYSSISQVGYILLALGCGSELGAVAATFHLFNHAIFKSLLFVNAAAVESRTRTTELSNLAGLGSKMPVTNTTTLFAMLSAAGVPPFAGFFSKLLIVLALIESDHFGFATVAVLASILTVAYFLSLQSRVFFGTPAETVAGVTEASPGYLVAALVLAATTLAAGVAFPFLLDSSLSFLLLSKSLPW